MSNHPLTAQGSDLPFSHKSVVLITHEQNIICSKTQLHCIVHEQSIIYRSPGGLSAKVKEEKNNRMIKRGIGVSKSQLVFYRDPTITRSRINKTVNKSVRA